MNKCSNYYNINIFKCKLLFFDYKKFVEKVNIFHKGVMNYGNVR